jgi:hypothetical protein
MIKELNGHDFNVQSILIEYLNKFIIIITKNQRY